MIVENAPQGSPEWQKARVGIPTASCFDSLITGKGEASKQRLKYMYQLSAERITGQKEETYQSKAMERGIEMEEEARRMYEFETGSNVEQVGLCYPDEKKLYGCSPDGLIEKDGVLEIKCPTSAVHVGYLLDNALPSAYFQQVQGQLLVTGRKYAHFYSYYPGLKPLLIRVMPDTMFLNKLRVELELFCKELDEITEAIR